MANLTVAFASQTGTSRDLAERFAREARGRGYTAALVPVDSLSVAALNQEVREVDEAGLLLVAFVSTTGDGEVPDHARQFWRGLLQRSLPSDSLSRLQFTVFGCGDSSYAKFNAAARKLCTRLLQLGGALFAERGLGDEQSAFGLAGDYDVWEKGVWGGLRGLCTPDRAPLTSEERRRLMPRCRVTVRCTAATTAAVAGNSPGTSAPDCTLTDPPFSWPLPGGIPTDCYPPFSAPAALELTVPAHAPLRAALERRVQAAGSTAGEAAFPAPFLARVTGNRRLTNLEWTQDVRSIELSVAGYFGPGDGAAATLPAPPEDLTASSPSCPGFLPGDIAVVYPSNMGDGGAAVEALASRLGVSLTDVIEIDTAAPDGGEGNGSESSASASSSAAMTTVRCGCAVCRGPQSLLPAACPYAIPAPIRARAQLEPLSSPPSLPMRTLISVRHLLGRVLDVLATPRRSFFAALAPFAEEAAAAAATPAAAATLRESADKLREMSSSEGADLYASYCLRERKSYADTLADFPDVPIPLAILCELIPPLQPRQFSIASAYAHSPGTLELCVAVVDYKTPWGRHKWGVASTWLASLQPGDGCEPVPLYIRRGTLRLPSAPSAPLLLIGPGTGVAPMRAIVQHRTALASSGGGSGDATHTAGEGGAGAGGSGWGDVELYFGCRHAGSDWLYGPEFQAAEQAGGAAGGLTGYHVAFSRDSLPRVVYVQGLLLRRAEAVFDLLTTEGSLVFISGSAKRMPADVVGVLADVVVAQGGATQEEAAAFLAALERSGRLVIEAWS